MSCGERRRTSWFVIVATIYFHALGVCSCVSLGPWEDGSSPDAVRASAGWQRTKQDNEIPQGQWNLGEQVSQSPNPRRSHGRHVRDLRSKSTTSSGGPYPFYSPSKHDETDGFPVHTSLLWTHGNISTPPSPWSSHTEDGYQGDFPGFHGVPGKVLGPSFDSDPPVSEWLAMKPRLQCDDNTMTFTVSGEGITQLSVDREGASPISLFQIPPNCSYSVRTSRSDLEMMVPYDACYITQENGSYVLPMLWGGSPLKLSCPIQIATPEPSHSAPAVLCSSSIMAVQLYVQEEDIPQLGVIVNGGWTPFVSAECAYRVDSQPQQIFLISFIAPCVTVGDGLQLHLIFDEREYILSCPVGHLFPHILSPPSSPLTPDTEFLNMLDPVSSPPTSSPPLPTQKHAAQFSDYPGLYYLQLPQVYPPGPQPVRPLVPSSGSAPGPQPLQQPLDYSDSGKFPVSPAEHPEQTSPQAAFTPKLPTSPSQHPAGQSHPYVQFHSAAVTQAPPPATTTLSTAIPPATQPPKPPGSFFYPQYYLHIPYYLAASTPPSNQPFPPSPPKQFVGPQYLGYPFDQSSYSYNYPYAHLFYPKHDLDKQPSSTPHPTTTLPPPPTTTTSRTMIPKQPDIPGYPFSQFYPKMPISFLPPTPLSAKKALQPSPQEHQQPTAQQVTCPPYAHTFCSYYNYPYFPYYYPPYPPPYPPVPQYQTTKPPVTTKEPTTSASSAAPTPTPPSPQSPHLQCLTGRMVAFLPFAHPDFIQVRDQKTWLFISSVSPACGYMIQSSNGSGVILHSRLPACHSQSRTSMTTSLPLRYWDLSMQHYRTLDLQCPHQRTPPVLVTPSTSPTPPSTSTSQTSQSVVLKSEVFCSSHQMTVELPPGPISEIVIKDMKGSQMNLQDAPKHCRYSATQVKDGKIRLTLQLHSRCLMSVQGKLYIITIVYMTVNGRKEAQFSCPTSISLSGQDCNLPSEQRLPCGHGSVSQPQCLSMGCCFSKQPRACYYPMDECTTDRHFVFSVPASLTEPPLSPSLLVVANNSTCKPLKVTSDYALFKIPMDGCGTHRVTVEKTMIYMVEVINTVQAISLNYGTITRDSPVRLLVECRYALGTVLTVGYLVKTPTVGPAVQTQGVFGVQLRIAKDAKYSIYYPQYHQPLQMLLGKPLYLEVRLLNAPDPSLVLLVHYCVAYPRSGKAIWVLLYNGCPNRLDPTQQQAALFHPRPPFPSAQTRRFTISTFQFLPDGEFKEPEEEIYFMCSTEICSPRDSPCVEGCFSQ